MIEEGNKVKIYQFPKSEKERERLIEQDRVFSYPRPKPVRRAKEPIVISAMPDQLFPIGHEDLRPLLQRDGLILLSWAFWEDWFQDGCYSRRYIVNWLASRDRYYHYATGPLERKFLEGTLPTRKGDQYFYRGLYGHHFDLNYYSDREVADYVYLAAPFDLCKQTVPGFIQILKSLGSMVNFDHAFSLGVAKEKQSAARQYLESYVDVKQIN